MATLDILSTTEAEQAVNDPSASATELERLNTAASLLIDERFGAVVQRTITAEEQPTRGGHFVTLDHWPIQSVTSVAEYDFDGTTRTVSVEDYDTKPTDGYRLTRRHDGTFTATLERRTGSSPGWWPAGGVVLATYVAGRFADTSSVDARFKAACGLVLQNLWRSQQTGTAELEDGFVVPMSTFPRFAMPKAVDELLRDELDVDDRWGIA